MKEEQRCAMRQYVPTCKGTFKPRRKWQRFCSPECRWRANAIRRFFHEAAVWLRAREKTNGGT